MLLPFDMIGRSCCTRKNGARTLTANSLYPHLNGVGPMTNRIDILKIVAVAGAIGVVFYFLAHRGV